MNRKMKMSNRIGAWLGIGLLAGWLLGCSSSDPDRPSAEAAGEAAQRLPGVTPPRADVPAGFRGEVHPSLDPATTLDVVATWTPTPTGRALKLGYFPAQFYAPFRELRSARPRVKYGARELSAFLPADRDLDTVGRQWSLDPDRVAVFLQQFHANVSMRVDSVGRLAGPDGAFAVLRAASPTHAEICFRMHAELEPEAGVFYTPSHFSGSLTLNKQTGRVEHFRLGIPTSGVLNVTLTVVLPSEALIDIVRVERMELQSVIVPGSPPEWREQLELAEAEKRLKESFYGFMEIDWVLPEEALARAQELQRPVLAIVLWGGLDEQSC